MESNVQGEGITLSGEDNAIRRRDNVIGGGVTLSGEDNVVGEEITCRRG